MFEIEKKVWFEKSTIEGEKNFFFQDLFSLKRKNA
jgi:hypothetical protein